MATATSEVIKLTNVRLSFPRLFKAKAFQEGQEPRFEASFLLDPTDKAHAKIIETIKAEAKKILEEKFGVGKIPKGVKPCFGMADQLGKEYDGYEGMFCISSNNKQRPVVVDRDRTPLAEEDGKPYAGCYVNGNITLWVQDNQFGKRINANLRSVQFVKDGTAFGIAPVDADEEFEDIAEAGSEAGADGDDYLS